MSESKYDKWKSLQSHWDDEEYLKSLSPFMRLRYRRLNERVRSIFEAHFLGLEHPFLLDVGCGRAEFAFFLSEQKEDAPARPSWNYLGVEPSPEQLNQRDIPHMGLGFIQATAENLPLQDMLAQGLLIKEALDHCYDPPKVFAEAKRLLKPGGILVVTVTNDGSYFKKLLPFVNRSLKAVQSDHLFFFTPADLMKLAREAGFDRVSVETYNYLKLPRFFERALGLLGQALNRGLLNFTDQMGKTFLPGLGGGIILVAKKKS